jgi:hypothetical protein
MGYKFIVIRDMYVGGGEADRPAYLLAFDDNSVELIGPAQIIICNIDLSLFQGLSDFGAGDSYLVDVLP